MLRFHPLLFPVNAIPLRYNSCRMATSRIISTKINLPRLRTEVVMRPRLLRLLHAGLARPSALTLVLAPAGYGKTTFVLSALQTDPRPCAWLSLEPEDDQLVRFLVYLISALQVLEPALGQRALRLFDGFQPPEIEAVLSTLILDLSAHPAMTLVLDDYHVIASIEIQAFLERFIELAQPYLQLILITRTEPPLPLAKWRARNLLAEIRATDLKFTILEATEFLRFSMHLDLQPQQIDYLEERTEGWVAGLQLAALSIQHALVEARPWLISGTQREVADYLMAEVLSQLPGEQRDFLLQTAFLKRMSAPLCNAVTKKENSQTLLEALEAGNFFIIPLDGSRTWFRYHHLFAEFLQKRLLTDYTAGEVREFYKRASRWLAEERFFPEAIDQALAANDYEYAAQLLGPQAEVWMRYGEVQTILLHLKKLPGALVWQQWDLCMWYGWTLALTGELEAATRWTNRLEELLTPLLQAATMRENAPIPDNLQNAYVQALAIRSIIARNEKDLSTAITLAEAALRLTPPDNAHLQAIASALLSAATLAAGKFDETESILRAARPSAYRTENPFILFAMLMDESALTAMRGQFHRAHTLNMEALQLAQTHAMQRLVPLVQFRLGRNHYVWNQLAEAQAFIQAGLQNSKPDEAPTAVALGLMALAQIQNAEAQVDAALQTLDEAEALATRHHDSESAERVRAARAQIQFWAGEEAAVTRWLKSGGWDVFLPGEPGYIFNDESFFLLCQILITSAHPDQWKHAERLLAWRMADAQKQQRDSTILKIYLMQALLGQTRRQPDSAKTFLFKALHLAQPENIIRPFLDEGWLLVPLLRRISQHPEMQKFAQTVLANQTGPSPSGVLVEPLSRQELQILQLLAQGYSNPEIARRLVLAVSTVRWYVKQIFRKIGVHNRTQAAAQARKLNLL